jgi:hypothetical protein
VLHAANQDRSLEHQVRVMFHRVVASWASDALSLRRRGLDRPSARERGEGPVAPAAILSTGWSERRYCEAPAIRWIPAAASAPSRLGNF